MCLSVRQSIRKEGELTKRVLSLSNSIEEGDSWSWLSAGPKVKVGKSMTILFGWVLEEERYIGNAASCASRVMECELST